MQELPLYPAIESVRLASASCQGCGRAATRSQVVFGYGNPDASLMLIGESPSATDDRTGQPFTGPAGKLLDQLLDEAGIHRRDIWITNLVRCFDGSLKNGRMENRPVRSGEVHACRTWFDMELRFVNPKVILAVGAPAAKQVIGPDFRLLDQHGQTIQRPDGRLAVAMAQPAWVMRLRTIDPDRYDPARADLVADIRVAAIAAGLISPR